MAPATQPDETSPPDAEARRRFVAMVERGRAAVCAVAFAVTGDRAVGEEVAQEALLCGWRKLDELDDAERLVPWLCGIARNLGRNARRRRREVGDPVAVDGAASEATPFDAVAAAEERRLVADALARIPERQREALAVFYQAGGSVAEVAAALDVSPLAARQLLSRGRKQVADRLAEAIGPFLAAGAPTAAFTATLLAEFDGGGHAAAASVVRGRGIGGAGIAAKLASAATVAVVVAGGAALVHRLDAGTAAASAVASPARGDVEPAGPAAWPTRAPAAGSVHRPATAASPPAVVATSANAGGPPTVAIAASGFVPMVQREGEALRVWQAIRRELDRKLVSPDAVHAAQAFEDVCAELDALARQVTGDAGDPDALVELAVDAVVRLHGLSDEIGAAWARVDDGVTNAMLFTCLYGVDSLRDRLREGFRADLERLGVELDVGDSP